MLDNAWNTVIGAQAQYDTAVNARYNYLAKTKWPAVYSPGPGGHGYAKAKVEVRQLLDGSWRIYRGDQVIVTKAPTELGELRAKKQRKRSAVSRAFRNAVVKLAAAVPA
ncbi:MAG: hypothetical protein HY698_05210 [Deltaproteobacteria bacterium]|nr:hypothetical protein [Deltaproteobacteria bacterium]